MTNAALDIVVPSRTADDPPSLAPSAIIATPMALLDRAVANGAGVEVLEKLMALQERYERNLARRAFDEAMAAAKADIPVILKNRTVDFTGKTGVRTNYRHEDMAEIARTVDPVLARHGLSYRFRTASPPGEPITVTCIVSHRGGHSEENTLVGPRDESGNKNAIQAIGSTITFLQRYSLKAALGLAASNDDDGQAASTVANGEDPVSETQVAELRRLIEDAGVPTEKVCAYAKVESLPEIKARHFAAVVTAIAAFKAKKGNT